jgi:hypothetical protein
LYRARYKAIPKTGDAVWRPGIVIGIGESWPETESTKAGVFINVRFVGQIWSR